MLLPLALLAASPGGASEPCAAAWLPRGSLAPVLVADPWQVRTEVVVRPGFPVLGGQVGDRVAVVRVAWDGGAAEAGFAAGLHLGFVPADAFTFGVATVDGLLEVPATVALGRAAVTLAWTHLSSHFADGVRYLEEPPEARDPHSRETLRAVAAWRGGWWTAYGGAHAILHAVPDAPWPGLQVGGAVEGPSRASPFLAVDGRWNGDTSWRTGASLLAGVRVRGPGGRSLRAGFAAYRGPRVQGMLADEDDAFVGALVAFDPEEVLP